MDKEKSPANGRNAKRQITAVIVGAGHRSLLYASYALRHPDELKIVGVVDPNELRRQQTAELHNIPPEFCFRTVEELEDRTPIADAAINGTMDKYHIPTSIPLLKAGYHLLLEKPIGVSEAEVLELLKAAREHKRKVMICHVLRYAPFYAEIRKRVAEGEIGDIIHIKTAENVSYHHMAVAFIRGKWARRDVCLSPILMAKCCHDLDIIAWIKSGILPKYVSSFGSLTYFKPDKAPEGAGTRCLVDCSIESECPYSAYKNYIEQGLWNFYAWDSIEQFGEQPTTEQKIASLKQDNPFGRCVWHCDNNVADHQSLMVEFEDGCTASHNLTGGTSKPCRSIHLIGTKGEIEGIMEDGFFVLRHPDARKGHEYTEERIDINASREGHGGGDFRLVEDFLHVLNGEKPSLSSTALEDSIYGHMIGFAADQAMLEKKVISISHL